MRCYNKATVIGHVGHDVTMRHTPNGKPVVNLRIATSERRRSGDELTTWHRVVLWDHLAEIANKYVRKGQPLYLEGPLYEREWVDREGVKHRTLEMTARELILLGAPANGGPHRATGELPQEAQPGQKAADGEELAEVEGEVPF